MWLRTAFVCLPSVTRMRAGAITGILEMLMLSIDLSGVRFT
jgi:hypothetical protein